MSAVNRYPWYDVVWDDSLEQGDILREFPVFDPHALYREGSDDYDVDVLALDVLVLSQSCDIEQGKVRSLALCPVYCLEDFAADAVARGEAHWNSSRYKESLRQGNIPGYHLISDFENEEISLPVSVVDFHEIYSAPTAQALDFIQGDSPRLRLCPPYKEHLAQAFARFFMRVGLPVGISREKLRADG